MGATLVTTNRRYSGTTAEMNALNVVGSPVGVTFFNEDDGLTYALDDAGAWKAKTNKDSDAGASATGIVMPAGGSGKLGWLSGIYNRLAGVVLAAGQKVGIQVAGADVTAENPIPMQIVGSLSDLVILLDAKTSIGYGPPLAMSGGNCVDFGIKGVGLTVLTINFCKVSPTGGVYPCLCSKVDATGALSLAVSTSILPTSGREVGASSPSTNISSETSPTFKIAVDGDVGINGTPTYHSITLNPTGLTTGALIAAALQVAIRALGGIYSLVTVTWSTAYTITSGTQGATSKVRIANGDTNNIADNLKIGAVNNAVDTDGTGEAWNASVPANWSFQLYVSSITGTSVTADGSMGVS